MTDPNFWDDLMGAVAHERQEREREYWRKRNRREAIIYKIRYGRRDRLTAIGWAIFAVVFCVLAY
jgi:hypothetical protein